jgi:transposase
MKNTVMDSVEELQKRIQALEEKNQGLGRENAELKDLLKYYEEQFRLFQHKKFSASSEKTKQTMPNQLFLFEESDETAGTQETEPVFEEITYRRRKRNKSRRKDDFSKLPVERMEYGLPEEKRVCSKCGGPMHVMGHETKQELEIIPAQVKIIEQVGEVYSCRNCEKNESSVPVIKAPVPKSVIKGSPASPSLIAYIMTQKYVNAMPLYRQEQDFVRNGLHLSRQTMVNWLLRSTEDWLEIIYSRLKFHLLLENVLHADETVLRVVRDPRITKSNSYMWLYRTSNYTVKPIVFYEYQPTRAGTHPKAFLEKFAGYLHTDGYSGYHNLPSEITIVGCWAHARRKFDEALKATLPKGRENLLAQKGLKLCNKLFSLERDYVKLTPEERYLAREERSKPVSEELFSWAERTDILPKSLTGRAICYLLAQKPYLENVFCDGRLELSNNLAERSIKNFVIGRKNWLFSNTTRGARASSVIYSVMETAKANNLKLFEYLKYLFQAMPNMRGDNFDVLLPWSKFLPDWCRLKP